MRSLFTGFSGRFSRRRPGRRELADPGDTKGPDTAERVASAYRKAAPILDAVWQLVGATLVGTLAGWWADTKLGTAPWVLIGGAVLGISTGMYAFLRTAMAIGKRGNGEKGKKA